MEKYSLCFIRKRTNPCFKQNDVVDNVVDDVVGNVVGNVVDNGPDNGPDNIPEVRMQLILELVKRNNKILLLELSEKLRVSKRTKRRDIEKLKFKNKLKRIGGEKGGYWEIIE